MKCLRKISILMVAILILVSMPVKVSATDNLKNTNEDSVLTDQKESEDISYMLGKGTDLYVGSVKISALGNSTINAYGSTVAHHTCDTMSLYIYIEQYNDGYWNSYSYYKYNENNISLLSKSVTLKVEPGHYYRLRGYHRTYKDGRQESTSSMTDGIYIS